MPSQFLGVGWSFPLEIVDGEVQYASYEESVRQAIWTILTTSHGERVMRPEFGCGLRELVFSLNNASTAGRVAYEVRTALDKWEPRIQTLAVDVRSSGEPDLLQVSIDCMILKTNSRMNMVFPFYLKYVRTGL